MVQTAPSHGDRSPRNHGAMLAPARSRLPFVVLLTSAAVDVPYGSYGDALLTAEWTPLEPDALAHKWYAKGVGMVRDQVIRGGDEIMELVAVAQ